MSNHPWLVLALVAAGHQPLHAADFYVDAANPTAGTGTLADPWREVASAIPDRQPGDTVHVANGTYAPFAINDLSGTAAAPIAIVVQAGATATINGGIPTGNRDGIRIRDSSHLVIDGFTLVGTGDLATSRAGISVQSSALGSRLGNGAVSGNHQSVTLRNNTIANYGKWGIFTAYVNGLVIEDNTLSGSVDEHGLYISNASRDQIVRGNTVFGNRGSGIQLNGDFAFGGGGIIANAVVERNLIFNNGVGGGGALNNEGVQDSVFRNNVLYDNHASGIVFWIGGNGAPTAASSNRNLAVNNTVIQAADGRSALQVDRGFDNVAFNNVLFHPGESFRDAISITTADTNTRTDFNLLSANFELAETDRTLAQWRSLTGNDLDSTVLTATQLRAMFVNFDSHDFRLAGGTAAVDSGTAAFGGGLAADADFAGTARPIGGGFDVGAYEFVPVPEPAVISLLSVAALLTACRNPRRRAGLKRPRSAKTALA